VLATLFAFVLDLTGRLAGDLGDTEGAGLFEQNTGELGVGIATGIPVLGDGGRSDGEGPPRSTTPS
jgi:hypothetical protein